MVLSACPEHAVSVRTMLLLYGEATTTFTVFIYGRSGSRTLTTHQSLSSPGGYGCVKVIGSEAVCMAKRGCHHPTMVGTGLLGWYGFYVWMQMKTLSCETGSVDMKAQVATYSQQLVLSHVWQGR